MYHPSIHLGLHGGLSEPCDMVTLKAGTRSMWRDRVGVLVQSTTGRH
jgi:hypothetical protein